MLRRRHINADPSGRSVRFLLALAELVRWPFERLLWAAEQRVLWPLQERAAGWDPPGRTVGAGALAAVAAAAMLVGALSLSGGEAPRERVAAPARVAIAQPPPQPQAERRREPALRGAPPSFAVGEGVGVARAPSGDSSEAEPEDSAGEAEAAAQAPQPQAAASATSSSAKPVPAGPAAMKVARRFSEAFVFYEVGERPARAKTVFGETATPQLAEALAARPPRQPQSAKVPQARVVNLVPGPRAGKAYTLSVSLLRVGLTSELRLEMRKRQGGWLVTDVRG